MDVKDSKPGSGRWSIALLSAVTVALLAAAVMQLIPRSTPSPVLKRTALTGSISFTGATLTAAGLEGSTAVTLDIANGTRGAIEIVGVSSPIARLGLLHYDANMCKGTSIMVQIPNVEDPSGRLLILGLKGTGAMLMRLGKPLRRADRVPVVLTWRNAEGVTRESRLVAVVVPRPRHLFFGSMTSMRM